MTDKEIIEKYKRDILENQNTINLLRKGRPFGIAAVFIVPFIAPFIPVRGRRMLDNFPYEFNVILCFILFSLMYISVYSNTISKKKKQIKRLEIWISQIEQKNN